MLIGREKEAAFLEEAVEREESQLLAVYGRRRVGKTYLIRETLKDRFTFQHAGIYKGTRKEQLNAFYAALRESGLQGDFQEPENWFEAFQLLKQLIQQSTRRKKILFIDELPDLLFFKSLPVLRGNVFFDNNTVFYSMPDILHRCIKIN